MLLTRPAKRADCRLFPAAHRGHAWPHTMLLTPGRGDHKNSQASLPMYMMSEGERQGSGLCVLPCVFPLPLSPAFTAAGMAKAGACRRARSGSLQEVSAPPRPEDKALREGRMQSSWKGTARWRQPRGSCWRDQTIPEEPGLPPERHLGHQHWSLLLLSLPHLVPNHSQWLHSITESTATAPTRVTSACCFQKGIVSCQLCLLLPVLP